MARLGHKARRTRAPPASTDGDNPERLRSEAALAALCGASPVEASFGLTVRQRLNRGGDRQADHALWSVALVRELLPLIIADVRARREPCWT
jgi:transposase